MAKLKFNNPLFETFKHIVVAVFGVVSVYTIIGLYSAFFTGIGYLIIKKYNKPNTKLLKDLQTGQYLGLVFVFLGLLPFLQYFFRGFALESASYAVDSIMGE